MFNGGGNNVQWRGEQCSMKGGTTFSEGGNNVQ